MVQAPRSHDFTSTFVRRLHLGRRLIQYRQTYHTWTSSHLVLKCNVVRPKYEYSRNAMEIATETNLASHNPPRQHSYQLPPIELHSIVQELEYTRSQISCQYATINSQQAHIRDLETQNQHTESALHMSTEALRAEQAKGKEQKRTIELTHKQLVDARHFIAQVYKALSRYNHALLAPEQPTYVGTARQSFTTGGHRIWDGQSAHQSHRYIDSQATQGQGSQLHERRKQVSNAHEIGPNKLAQIAVSTPAQTSTSRASMKWLGPLQIYNDGRSIGSQQHHTGSDKPHNLRISGSTCASTLPRLRDAVGLGIDLSKSHVQVASGVPTGQLPAPAHGNESVPIDHDRVTSTTNSEANVHDPNGNNCLYGEARMMHPNEERQVCEKTTGDEICVAGDGVTGAASDPDVSVVMNDKTVLRNGKRRGSKLTGTTAKRIDGGSQKSAGESLLAAVTCVD